MKEYLTCKAISDDTGLKLWTIQKWVRDGKLPAYKIGREYRVLLEDYQRFLEEQKTNKGDDAEPKYGGELF